VRRPVLSAFVGRCRFVAHRCTPIFVDIGPREPSGTSVLSIVGKPEDRTHMAFGLGFHNSLVARTAANCTPVRENCPITHVIGG